MNKKRILIIVTILLFCITRINAQKFDLESLTSVVEDSTSLSSPIEDYTLLTTPTSAYPVDNSNSSSNSKKKKKRMTVRNFNIVCMANLAFRSTDISSIGRHMIMLSYERGAFERGLFRIGIDLGFTKYSFLQVDETSITEKSGFTACILGKYGFELCWKDSRIKFGFGQTAGGMFKVGIVMGAYFRLTCYVIGRLAVNVIYEPCGAFSFTDKSKGGFLSLMGFGVTYQLKK